MITKVSLNENEVFSIKGVDGENYVFDGTDLFLEDNVDFEDEKDFEVSVIKSLRTKSGAESWLKVAGFKYENAEIVDTDTLKSYGVDYDGSNRYHVIQSDMREDTMLSHDDVMAAPEDGEDTDGSMARAQLRSILDDAEELHTMIRDRDDLEPWVQAKITKAADYLSMLHGYLEHYVMEGELDIDDFLQKAITTTESEMSDNSTVDDDASSEVIPGGSMKGMEDAGEDTATEDGSEETAEEEEDTMKSVEQEDDSQEEEVSMKSADDSEESEESEEEETMKAVESDSEESEEEEDEGDTVNVHIDTDEHEFGNTEKSSVVGKVFKSMHAAKQWNRYENPDKDRYYIDILRTKDRRDPWTRSLGMNAKYVVRDRNEDPVPEQKGFYGNRIHKK